MYYIVIKYKFELVSQLHGLFDQRLGYDHMCTEKNWTNKKLSTKPQLLLPCSQLGCAIKYQEIFRDRREYLSFSRQCNKSKEYLALFYHFGQCVNFNLHFKLLKSIWCQLQSTDTTIIYFKNIIANSLSKEIVGIAALAWPMVPNSLCFLLILNKAPESTL